jgi:hypothetical protein
MLEEGKSVGDSSVGYRDRILSGLGQKILLSFIFFPF